MKKLHFALGVGLLVIWRAPLAWAAYPGRTSSLAVIVILTLAATIVRALSSRPQARLPKEMLLWSVALLFLLSISFVRAGLTGLMPWPAVLLNVVQWTAFCVIAYLMGQAGHSTKQTSSWVCNALFAYVGFNVALALLGFENLRVSPFYGSAQMLDALGLSFNRMTFPTADGLNNFGVVAGAALVGAILTAKERPSAVPAMLLAAIPAGFVLLASDSRAAVGSALAAGLAAALVPRRRVMTLAIVVTAIVAVAPLSLMAWSSQLNELTVAHSLSRGARDLTTLSSREAIWDGALSTQMSASTVQRLFGFGAYGQVQSRAIAYYEKEFNGTDEPHTLHNTVYQYLADTGYLGLLVVGGVLYSNFRRLNLAVAIGTPHARTLAGLLVYLLAAGITEATATVYYPESLALLMFISGATAALPVHDAKGLAAPARALRLDHLAVTNWRSRPAAGSAAAMGRKYTPSGAAPRHSM